MCNSCRCHLFRQRRHDPKKPKLETKIKVKEFMCHSDICEICGTNNPDEEKTKIIEDIIKHFGMLEHSDKINCLKKLIESCYLEGSIKDKVKDMQGKFRYYDIDVLEGLKLEDYLHHFDDILLSTILTFTGNTVETIGEKLQHIIPTLESIYRLCDSKFIGPWSFMQNLIVFASSKSKIACNVLGSAVPGAKYSRVSSFLNEVESRKEPVCPEGDLIFMFDNEQVIGKSWNVSATHKVKSSVITNVAVVQAETNENIQKIEELMPGKWLTTKENSELISDMCADDRSEISTNNQFTEWKDAHYKELYRTLDIVIQQLTEEQIDQTGKYSDHIDQTIERRDNEKKYKKCPNCNVVLEKSKRKCPSCNISIAEFNRTSDVNKETIGRLDPNTNKPQPVIKPYEPKSKEKLLVLDRYGHIESSSTGKAFEIILLDPVFVNPNSLENIILVLRHIAKKAKIAKYLKEKQEGARYWTFICCDGLPHGLVRKLIEEYLVCSICGQGFLGVEAAQKHEISHLNRGESTSFCIEFDWVFLITGDGHYEMNLTKSFMELNWHIFMKSLVNVLGWKSEKAQRSALVCADNHKAWQMMLIFHIGSLLELVRPYVQHCMTQNQEASSEGFISFVKSQGKNSNFMYLFEMACRYSQGIVNLRMGIRRNNSTLLRAGKWITKELFHGRNHPKYQDIEIYESFMYSILPSQLKEFFKTNCSLSKSGHLSKGQGYDFVLEEENKLVKSWL